MSVLGADKRGDGGLGSDTAAAANTAAPTTVDVTDLHPLPFPFSTAPAYVRLLTQGAEALVYRVPWFSVGRSTTGGGGGGGATPTALLKYRPPKPYRHPVLDRRLTRQRVLAEARMLVRCRRAGVAVPAVLALDWERGWLAMEWVEGGVTVRGLLDWLEREREGVGRDEEGGGEREMERVVLLEPLMRRVGRAVARMHEVGVVHGDLTTSNLMVRPRRRGKGEEEQKEQLASASSSSSSPRLLAQEGTVVLIDFGLAQATVQDEDRAVDLYVLERAFGATHPAAAEELFALVLRAYADAYPGAKVVLRRLEDVRLRGRKKSMLG